MILFKILWGIDAVAALVFLYFFFTGLTDGSVSGDNAGTWLLLLAAFAGILGGSLWLRRHGHAGIAQAVLLIVAVPALLYGLYLAFAVIAKPRWN